jgi:hypothetical protein
VSINRLLTRRRSRLHGSSRRPPSTQRLFRRLVRNGLLVGGLLTGAVGMGAWGYHAFAGLPWLDAALNAAMILTGMGPVNPMVKPSGKLFAIVYALFSGVFFLTMVAVLLAPALHHFLHRFHLELDGRVEASDPRPGRLAGPRA